MRKIKLVGGFLFAAFYSGIVAAIPINFDVFAGANSIVGGSGLDTGISYVSGDTITASTGVNDLWNAGPLPRWSNANGLVLGVELLATGTDESGEAAGTVIGGDFFSPFTTLGFTANFGSLVGKINNTFFVLGTAFNAIAPDTGNLELFYWDQNNFDNTEFVTVTIDDGTIQGPGQIPEPTSLALFGIGLAGFGFQRRKQGLTRLTTLPC